MKILNPFLMLLALLVVTGVQAQSEDSDNDVDCQKELSFFAQSAKIRDYDAALPYYNNLIENCPPDMSAAVYQYGNRMFLHYIDEAKDEETKKKNILAFIDNYSKLEKYYPDRTHVIYDIRIAQYKLDYNLGTTEEQYQAFDNIWKKNKEEFNDPKALYSYFSLLIDLQDEGKRGLEEAFQKYDEVIEKIETEESIRAEEDQTLRQKQENGETLTPEEETTLRNAGIYLSNYMKIKESIETKIGTRADCDNLIPIFSKKFDENKGDAEWLKIVAQRLSAKGCTDGDLFLKITEALHQLEPSAKSAKYLGQLAAHNGNMSRALDYYKQSAELESKKLDKARVYYMIGNIYNNQGQMSQARTYYRRALANNPALGNAHLQIASMYAKSVNTCGETDFEKRAVYWAAAREADAAGRVDPSIRSHAQQTAEAYRGRAPQNKDIFNEEMSGKTINIGCWINETVKVPKV